MKSTCDEVNEDVNQEKDQMMDEENQLTKQNCEVINQHADFFEFQKQEKDGTRRGNFYGENRSEDQVEIPKRIDNKEKMEEADAKKHEERFARQERLKAARERYFLRKKEGQEK